MRRNEDKIRRNEDKIRRNEDKIRRNEDKIRRNEDKMIRNEDKIRRMLFMFYCQASVFHSSYLRIFLPLPDRTAKGERCTNCPGQTIQPIQLPVKGRI
jgi:hypothetical protein